MAALKITAEGIFPNHKKVKKATSRYIKVLKKAQKAHDKLIKALK